MTERFSAVSHGVGALLSIAALALLVTFAALKSDAFAVTAFAIFGASLVVLYTSSTLYHLFPESSRARRFFRVLDHCAIYLLIAGTYTPVTLLLLPRAWGWSMFGVVWGLAMSAMVFRLVGLRFRGWAATLPYLALGWLILLAFRPLVSALSPSALFYLVAGGLFYSIGALFFALDSTFGRKRAFTFHDGFHVLTMLGSASHVWLMFWFVLPMAR